VRPEIREVAEKNVIKMNGRLRIPERKEKGQMVRK